MEVEDKYPKIIFYCRIGRNYDVDNKKDDKIKFILNEKLKRLYQSSVFIESSFISTNGILNKIQNCKNSGI